MGNIDYKLSPYFPMRRRVLIVVSFASSLVRQASELNMIEGWFLGPLWGRVLVVEKVLCMV